MIATEKTIFDIFKFILDHIWLRGFGGIREIIISFLSIPQASQPRMNFNISELVNQYFFGCGQPNAKGALSLLLVAHQRYAGFVPWKVRGFFCTLAQVHEFNLTTKLLLLFWNVFFWGGGVCLGFWELASLQLFIVKSSITPLKLRLVKSACGNSSVLYRTFVQTKYILFKILPTNSQFIYLFFIYTKS